MLCIFVPFVTLPDNEGRTRTLPRRHKTKGHEEDRIFFVPLRVLLSLGGELFKRTLGATNATARTIYCCTGTAADHRPGATLWFRSFSDDGHLARVHPSHRYYSQWGQMEEQERELHRHDMADIYIATAERYGHSAIFIHPNPDEVDETIRTIDIIREKTGDRYFIMRHGDATFSIPDGTQMFGFAERLADDPDGLKREAQQMVDAAIRRAERYAKHGGLDGFALCADYCFNTGPFSVRHFAEFITPYLAQITKAYREAGLLRDQAPTATLCRSSTSLSRLAPALHSLDLQANVDIVEVKRRYGDQLCLIGNVNCAMLDTGTPEDIAESAVCAAGKRHAWRRLSSPPATVSTRGCCWRRHEVMPRRLAAEGVA